MDSHDDPEKLHDDGAIVATRAVAFGPEHATEDVAEKAPHGLRPKGVEMKRELTKEDKELANAGYEHLTRARTQEGKEGGEGKMDHVDIVEHKLIRTFFSRKPGDGEVNVEPRRSEIDALGGTHEEQRSGYVEPAPVDQISRLRVSQHTENRLSEASRYDDDDATTATTGDHHRGYATNPRKLASTTTGA